MTLVHLLGDILFLGGVAIMLLVGLMLVFHRPPPPPEDGSDPGGGADISCVVFIGTAVGGILAYIGHLLSPTF